MNPEAPAPANNRWPPQIKYIIGNEAAERFSYYGMVSILMVYITDVLEKSKDDSAFIIHGFKFFNYFMPLIGAWVSDRYWGRYKTILWISLAYCVGHGVLAFSDVAGTKEARTVCLYAGLALIAFGSGGIKPCVSAFLGDQFQSNQRHLLQKAYAAFYWAINFGSFFSMLMIPQIKNHSWAWAFGVPGILMGVATLVFWLGTRHYVMVPPTRVAKKAGFFKVLLYALRNRAHRPSNQERPRAAASNPALGLALLVLAPVLYVILGLLLGARGLPDAIGNPAPISIAAALGCIVASIAAFAGKFRLRAHNFWDTALARFSPEEVDAARSVGPILSIFALIPVFWALFDQTHTTWIAQGQQMIPMNLPFGWKLDASAMQSINPLMVMTLVPLLTLVAYPALGRFASPLKRMASGFFLAGFSFVVVAWLQTRVDAGEQLSILWQILPYLILTTAEVLVSTTGLEFAFREAAPSMKSTIMGFWNLSVALGNLVVMGITKVLATADGHGSVTPGRFMLYAGMTFVAAILFTLIAAFYKYNDESAAQGK